MSFSYNGRVFLTDNEGFLLNKDEWTEDLMFFMAKNLGLTLTEQHKTVINEVREYYKEYATTPAMRVLITTLKKKGYSVFYFYRIAFEKKGMFVIVNILFIYG